jgi:hypothetical protein
MSVHMMPVPRCMLAKGETALKRSHDVDNGCWLIDDGELRSGEVVYQPALALELPPQPPWPQLADGYTVAQLVRVSTHCVV